MLSIFNERVYYILILHAHNIMWTHVLVAYGDIFSIDISKLVLIHKLYHVVGQCHIQHHNKGFDLIQPPNRG